MKFELLINILFELLAKKTVKAEELANKHGVSVRTIYRYFETLEGAGVPIYTTRGRNGGISVIDSFRLSSTFMTRAEFQQTIDTLSAITASVPNKTLESAILKLKSTIKNEYTGFEVKSGSLIIDAGPWGDTVGYKRKLAIIEQSLEKSLQLEIAYHDRNGSVTERVIEPYIILFKQGIWYVFAYCTLRKEFRFFKIGRIEKANILATVFKKVDISKMELPLDFWHNAYTAINVELEVNKAVVSDVEEWLGVENVFIDGDKITAKAKLPDDNGLVSKIMSFGSNVKVISPKALKDKVKKNSLEIIKNYS